MFKDFTRVTRREDAPELPKLPVYQEIYCSQGITDALCDYVMEHAPWDTVLWQIYAEDEPDDPAPYLRNEPIARIRDYIINNVSNTIEVPDSDLGILDFGYEFRRRVRVSQGWMDISVEGKPLAPTPDGPYPDMIDLPIRDQSQRKWPVTQALVDLVIRDAYTTQPSLFYLLGEYKRRHDDYWWVNNEIIILLEDTLVKHIDAHHQGFSRYMSNIQGEVSTRIGVMCNIPRYLKHQENILKRATS